MFPKMELRHLRYFVAVAEELSFTKAAQKLRLAQPSLTRQVRRLEDEIGVRLLDRANNRVALTEEGTMVLLDSKKLLALCAESVAAVQRMKRGDNAQLNIGYTASTHHELLPATLGVFRKLRPGVALNLFDMSSAEQFRALDEQRIDLGFVGLDPALSDRALLSQRVTDDVILVALGRSHRLAKRPLVKLTDLAQQFFICMSAKTDPGDCEWVRKTCQSAGFTAKVLQEAVDEPGVIRFVKDGLGVALMPERITNLPHEGVVFRRLSPSLHRESMIAWRADNLSVPLKHYLEIVKDLLRSM